MVDRNRTYVVKAAKDDIFWGKERLDKFTRYQEAAEIIDLEVIFENLHRFKKGDMVIRNYGEDDEKTIYVIP